MLTYLRRRYYSMLLSNLNLERNNDWLVDDVNFMMNNNKEHVTQITLNETGSGDCNEVKKLSNDNTAIRSFGITDLWSMRRNARTFKIHNRIPRL